MKTPTITILVRGLFSSEPGKEAAVALKKPKKSPSKRRLLRRKPQAYIIARVEVFEKSGAWRWRAETEEEKIVSESEESYSDREQAHQAARAFFPSTPVEDAA